MPPTDRPQDRLSIRPSAIRNRSTTIKNLNEAKRVHEFHLFESIAVSYPSSEGSSSPIRHQLTSHHSHAETRHQFHAMMPLIHSYFPVCGSRLRERGAKHWSDFRILLRLLFFLRLHSFLFFWSLSLHHFLFVIVHCKNNQFVIACKAVYYLFLLGVLFGFGFYSSFLFAAIILLELVGRTNKKSVWWWNSRQ